MASEYFVSDEFPRRLLSFALSAKTSSLMIVSDNPTFVGCLFCLGSLAYLASFEFDTFSFELRFAFAAHPALSFRRTT
jgi:hypothetical protein